MKIAISKPTLDMHGRHGVSVHLRFEAGDDGWAGSAHFTTHGMTMQQVVVARNKLVQRHRKKAAKLTQLAPLWKSKHRIGNFFITDASVLDAGTGFVLRVAAFDGKRRVELRKDYGDPSLIPDNETVVGMLMELIDRGDTQQVNGASHAAAVRKALGVDT